MSGLSPSDQVAAFCQAPLAMRTRLLELSEQPEALVPLIPEAELCFTCKAIGVEDASWLLALATPEQIVACVDLDAWHGLDPDIGKLDNWMAAIVESGNETIFKAAESLDPEVLSLYLRAHADVELKPTGDESWQPPEGSQTLEGQFYLTARHKNDDLAALLRILHVIFDKNYWLYFRLMHSVREEALSELQEWALRWRTGRLEDLGFPPWERAMRIYGFLQPRQLAELPPPVEQTPVTDWALPIWFSELPSVSQAGYSVFRAVADLESDERSRFFFAFISLANQLAVADRRDLGDAKTLPNTIEKAAQVGSRGLEYIATEHAMEQSEVLRRVPIDRLFRVGVNLDREAASPPLSSEDHVEDGEVE